MNNDQHWFVRWFHQLSSAKLLLLFYVLAILFSTSLLLVPAAYQEGVHIKFIDTLFVAVSALSVTGLTPVSIPDTYSTIGIFILALIMHLGAVGVMAVSTFIWLLIGKKIGIAERRLIMRDQNQTAFGGMVDLIRQIIYVVFVVEVLGIIILGTYFIPYYPTVKEAYFQGFFSTISAISNAGFSMNHHSLASFSGDYFVQSVIMFLIIFGAIGFPVLIEVKRYLFSKKNKKKLFRFSLFTKVTTTTFFFLVLVGTIGIYLIDVNGFMQDKAWHEGLFYALFQSVTTRSAGLSTMDINVLSESNRLFMSALMFIGASPSSAGGGIRTTTFALVLIFIITYARGGKRVKVFNRQIYDRDLMKAVTIMILAIFFIFLSVLILSLLEPYSMTAILFEVTSAFGNVGLSTGITTDLTSVSKIILMLLMFIGRIGIVTFLYTFRRVYPNDAYIRYPKERIIIG